MSPSEDSPGVTWLEKADGVAAANRHPKEGLLSLHVSRDGYQLGRGSTQLCERFAKMELEFTE